MTPTPPVRAGGPAPRIGRRPSTSRAELEHHALELFAARGFERTTVGDIAAAAGIGRRTFFRYYGSKNDVVWGDFDGELDRMRAWFAACPSATPLMEALRGAIVAFNRLEPGQVSRHRQRMALILTVPELQAHSTLRYAAWRAVVAEFAARRLGQPADALMPQVVAHTALGAALAAYGHWLREEGSDLEQLLDEALGHVAAGFRTGPGDGRRP
ncbi:mycofactocin system transcriptional regulator [Streptomyces sp. NPDC005017]|uniref:mycofactocin system transcriptional regulator n=1 Tax=Streptomyces sp. NPDC005017 TaxID=3364706 RepID=UPI0036BB4F1D